MNKTASVLPTSNKEVLTEKSVDTKKKEPIAFNDDAAKKAAEDKAAADAKALEEKEAADKAAADAEAKRRRVENFL